MLLKIKRIVSNIKALFEYPGIYTELSKERDIYFFFPYWSFGGAERVHVDILNTFKNKNTLCFITERSKNEGFRKEYEAVSDVINLGRWAEKKAYKAYLLKKVAKAINRQKKPIMFGWCSRFMYDLIPLLDSHVKIIDLTHNFTEKLTGIEWYSLPYIPRIEKRVVIGKTIIKQFEELYTINKIPLGYLDRLMVIQNKMSFENTKLEKDYDDVLRVLFVARNSPEKRPDVFIKIAQRCIDLKLPVEFEMIGDFNSYKNSSPSNLRIIGEIHDKVALNNYYQKAHLLLLTSIRESWGLVIFEGMNYGVVPISTNVGELSDYVSIDKQNGILLDNQEDEDILAELFVKEINRFVDDRIRLKIYSENALETVKSNFNESNFTSSYQRLILGETL